MLHKINRYYYGYIVIPVILTLKKNNFFSLFAEEGTLSKSQLGEMSGLNATYLNQVLHLLETLGWLSQSVSGEYSVTQIGLTQVDSLPNLLELYQCSIADYAHPNSGNLRHWIDSAKNNWGLHDELLIDYCNGSLFIPLLISLKADGHLISTEQQPLFSNLLPDTRVVLTNIFIQNGWINDERPNVLTDAGRFIINNIHSKLVDTYHSALSNLQDIFFGIAPMPVLGLDELFSINQDSYQELERATIELFNRQPIEQQPKYLLYSGHLDGECINRIHQAISQKTVRGSHLDKFPLTYLIYNNDQAVLHELSNKVTNLSYQIVHGESDDLTDLQTYFASHHMDADDVLVINTFKDYRLTQSEQNWTSYFENWSKFIGRHGLLSLESHAISSAIEQRHLDDVYGLSFFEPQKALAQNYLMQAARASLLPSYECAKRYPEDKPFSQITLNHFQKRPYLVRPARADDISDLLKLEEECWIKPLRASRSQLLARIERYEGQYVAVLEGRVVAVVYTQRLDDEHHLFNYNFRQIESHHSDNGHFLQLLAANVLPTVQGQGLGDQLIEFVLQRAALMADIEKIIAVTRCRDFEHQKNISMDDYITLRNHEGLPVDPVLYFHELHGAKIGQVISGYRPGDKPNSNDGVLISYDIRARKRLDLVKKQSPNATAKTINQVTQAKLIEDSIQGILKTKGKTELTPTTSLMVLGFESVDFSELAGVLNNRLNLNLKPEFFFAYPTIQTITKAIMQMGTTDIQAVEKEKKTDSSSFSAHKPLATKEKKQNDKIAIIGLSCRLPGEINSPKQYWDVLKNGKDVIKEIPESRWKKEGKHKNAAWGGFVDKVEYFDASFFNTSAGEAAMLDPQQRIHLESVWSALEDAGVNPLQLSEKEVGIYVGLFTEDYKQVCVQTHNDASVYFATGTSGAAAAGRTAHFLGTQGPAVMINTACSSSLVALHYAKESLLQGESELAIASGVNLMLTPELSENFANAGMLSPDGRCKSFSGSANGYVRSEGCAVVVLKRLSDALAQGDRIYAVLESSVVNQDGKSTVLTAPNPLAQKKLFESALAAAHLEAGDIDYIEAHGTGTSLGDAMEVGSVLSVYGKDRHHPLIMGSAKANIGHTESVAGLAGLIKVVLSMQHQIIPKQLHIDSLNSSISHQEQLVVPTQSRAWKKNPHRTRFAGVSSFGFSGTNAHVILSESPKRRLRQLNPIARPYHILSIAAKTPEALQELIKDYIDYFAIPSDASIPDICYTSNVARADFECRLAVVVEANNSLQRALSERFKQGQANKTDGQNIAFLFTGEDSSCLGMGLEFYEKEPVYQRAFDACLNEFARALYTTPSSLRDVILYKKPISSDIDYAAVAVFSFEYALFQWWKSIDVTPNVVLGDGVGEYVAAVVSGIMSLRDGVLLAVYHSRVKNDRSENKALREEFLGIAEAINYQKPMIPLISIVTGKTIEKIDINQLNHHPHYQEGFSALDELKIRIFLELGPKSLLTTQGQKYNSAPSILWLGHADPRALYENLSFLYEVGVSINWDAYHKPFSSGYEKVDLPTYHFMRQRYWLNTPVIFPKDQPVLPLLHPLLGVRLAAIADQTEEKIVFQHQWPTAQLNYLNDHQVVHTMIVPGAAYIEMCWVAMQLALGTQNNNGYLADISIESPLSLNSQQPRTVQTIIEKINKVYTVRIFSCDSEAHIWQQHASARWVKQKEKVEQRTILPIKEYQSKSQKHSADILYAHFNRMGLNYGEAFKGITSLHLSSERIIAEIELSDGTEGYYLPPSLLDGCFQSLIALHTQDELYLPVGISALHMTAPLPKRIFVVGELLAENNKQVMKARGVITNESFEVLGQIEGFSARHTTAKALQNMLQVKAKQSIDSWFYTTEWLPEVVERPPVEHKNNTWLLIAKNGALLTDYKEKLIAQNDSVHMIELVDTMFLSQINDIMNQHSKLTSILWIDETTQHPSNNIPTGELIEKQMQQQYGVVLTILQQIQQRKLNTRLVLVTQGAQTVFDDCTNPLAANVWGLATTARHELTHTDLLVIDADPKFSLLEQRDLILETLKTSSEHWIALRNNTSYMRRLKSYKDFAPALIIPKEDNFSVVTSEHGEIGALTYEAIAPTILASNEVRIRVNAVGLNFRDVLNALHLYPGDPGPLGCDCAGEVLEVGSQVSHINVGDRVLAMSLGCLRTEVVTPSSLVAPLPAHMTYNEAATIPTVFLTVYECLIVQAKLKKGDRVLIHTATGGVGLAAIQICKWIGAEVYATAGSSTKQSHLKSLGVKHIYSSRSLDFKRDILEEMKQPVIDVVLNTLTGPGYIEGSLAVCSKNARFVEISKLNVWTAQQMAEARPDVIYSMVALDSISLEAPEHIAMMWQELMPLFEQGILSPLPKNCFDVSLVRNAFTSMQQAQHIGKIVVEIPSKEVLAHYRQKPELTTISVSRGSHLITGGLGGLGLATASWLLAHGAKSLILTSRRSPSEEALTQIKQWATEFKASIRVWSCDVANQAAVEELMHRIHKEALPPLRGIFHSAGFLSDGLIQKQNWSTFKEVYDSKVLGAWNLHTATAQCELDYFVMFSSMTAVLGNIGQCNYGAANACLDSLVHFRQQQGLVAQSINWGPWAEVGMAANLHEQFAATGFSSIPVAQGLQALGRVLSKPQLKQTMISPIDWPQYLHAIEPDPFYSQFSKQQKPQSGNIENQFVAMLTKISMDDRLRLMKKKIEEILEQIVEAAVGKPKDFSIGFTAMGLDSLKMQEARTKLALLLGNEYFLSPTILFDYPSVNKLSEYILTEVLFQKKASEIIRSNEPVTKQSNSSSDRNKASDKAGKHDKASSSEPIAVIGLSCRFPGGANHPEAYWDILQRGKNAISHVPADRWNADDYYDPDAKKPHKMVTRNGGFLTQPIQDFDASFFHISPREAEMLDPQQRLLLELTWEALEHANIDPHSLAESLTGVYMGMCSHDYKDLLDRAAEQAGEAFHSINVATGNAFSTASGRISYLLGLQGPNLSIDTACSSSLVSVHEACKSLRIGESNLALAGGVNVILSPDVSINFSQGKMLSPDGNCKTFDEKANGYVRGEGCGIVVLKRLSDAIADGDLIHAVIRGSAVNQDGASSGLTVPNGPAQERLIKQALTQAQVDANDVSYIEAHGTGTQLGDPIEFGALGNVYGKNRKESDVYTVGTAKVNIGHLEGAAGIAGLIKVILSLRHETLPPHRNFDTINPKIDLAKARAHISTQIKSWKRNELMPRIAGLSSFGFSGTNAHLIIGDAPPTPELIHNPHPRHAHVFSLSAKSPEALYGLAQDYIEYFAKNPSLRIEDVCYTSNVARTVFDTRLSLCIASGERIDTLASALQQRIQQPLIETSINGSRKLAFLFTGQGSQWLGMGASWYAQEPVFQNTFDYCLQGFKKVLKDAVDIDLLRKLILASNEQSDIRGKEHLLNETLYSQIAIFSVEYALSVFWQHIGLYPDSVMGHSIGECVAAVVAGVLSLDDGIILVAHRARLMQSLQSNGAMVAIQSSKDIIEGYLNEYLKDNQTHILAIAADNCPDQVVVSGTKEAVAAFIERYLVSAKIRHTKLVVSNAFHSPCMQPIVNEFLAITTGLTYKAPTIPLVSNVTGQIAKANTIDAHYWMQHLTQAVRCREGFELLSDLGMTDFIELGPRSVLLQFGQKTLAKNKRVGLNWLASIKSQAETPYQTLALLFEAGYRLNWSGFHEQSTAEYCRKVILPTYHFIRKRCWPEALDALLLHSNHPQEKTSITEVDYEVVIIGGGAAGLSALGRLKANHHERVLLLEQEEHFGGIWYTTKYPNVGIQSKNFSYKFFDFDAPESVGEHASAAEIVTYFSKYINHNQLGNHISLAKKVTKIVYFKNNDNEHKCSVYVTDVKTGEERILKCSHVICALGFSSAGNINKPIFPKTEQFRGKIVHSSEFNQAMLDDIVTNDKKVCILGAGKSAYDLALQTSQINPNNVTWIYDKFLWGLNYEFIYNATASELRQVYAMYATYDKLYKQNPHSKEARAQAKEIIKTGYLLNIEEDNFDIYQSRSAIYKPSELRWLQERIRRIKSKIATLENDKITLENGEVVQADYLICGTGYQHASNLPLIVLSSDGKEETYDIRNQPMLFRSMIDPNIPHIAMFTGQTLFPQQLLIYSIAAEWYSRLIDGNLDKEYSASLIHEEIAQDIKEHGSRYNWHPERSKNLSQGSNYIIDSPFLYFKRMCEDLGLSRSFISDIGVAIAHQKTFDEISEHMREKLLAARVTTSAASKNKAFVYGQQSIKEAPKAQSVIRSTKETLSVASLLDMTKEERFETVQHTALTVLRQVMSLRDNEIIQVTDSFVKLGIDSLVWSNFRICLSNALQMQFGNRFLNCLDIRGIAQYVEAELFSSEVLDFDHRAARDFDSLEAKDRDEYYKKVDAKHQFLIEAGFKRFQIVGSKNISTEIYCGGVGETIVLLPPLNCGINAWREQLLTLSKNYRVISIHYPGYGRSGFDPDLVNIEAIADHLHELLEIVSANQRVHLVGWSYGGHVSLPFARKYPDKLLSLCVVSSTACLESMYKQSNYETFDKIMKGLMKDFDNSVAKDSESSSAFRTINELKGTFGIHTFTHYALDVTRFDYREHLDKITVPTLVIAGSSDLLTTPEYMRLIAHKIQHATYLELEGAGHYLPLFHPAYFNEHLMTFINNQKTCMASQVDSSHIAPVIAYARNSFFRASDSSSTDKDDLNLSLGNK